MTIKNKILQVKSINGSPPLPVFSSESSFYKMAAISFLACDFWLPYFHDTGNCSFFCWGGGNEQKKNHRKLLHFQLLQFTKRIITTQGGMERDLKPIKNLQSSLYKKITARFFFSTPSTGLGGSRGRRTMDLSSGSPGTMDQWSNTDWRQAPPTPRVW